jgi:general secretion pathway protein A
LNYETNEYKLLQIVIFAQPEFAETLHHHSNVSDRISLFYFLKPLNFHDTKSMIQFRLNRSGKDNKTPPIFSPGAVFAIYRHTNGYPRKIVHTCHQGLLAMIIQNRNRVDFFWVRSFIRRKKYIGTQRHGRPIFSLVCCVIVLIALYFDHKHEKVIMHHAKTWVRLLDRPQTPALFKSRPKNSNDMPAKSIQIPPKKTDRVKKITSPYGFPSILGRIVLKPNENLWMMIRRIYGEFSSRHMHTIRSANPHIADPDKVNAGEEIIFPATPVVIDPSPKDAFFIEISKHRHLHEAYDQIGVYLKQSHPIKLIPYWNERSGMWFAILYKKWYTDRKSATEEKESLPYAIASQSKIISAWGRDTVFFVNPF